MMLTTLAKLLLDDIYVQQRRLHYFSQFLNLLFATSHVTVSDVRFLLDLHHGDSRVDLRG
jgi:hypothetical protein